MPLNTSTILLITSFLSLFIWLILIILRGQFWRSNLYLDTGNTNFSIYPDVCVIIPARNEADVIETSIKSLLQQNYLGNFHVILVDDQSQDQTDKLAKQIAIELGKEDKLDTISGKPLPSDWTGKLWAMQQGMLKAQTDYPNTKYYLFTDADIEHERDNLNKLVKQAETHSLALVSLMVKLRCQSFWEKLLIPAFVFFFQKLYPFAWVNNPQSNIAAAAGGCILIDSLTLKKIDGFTSLRNTLIDDCNLAQAVKSSGEKIWLGLSKTTRSLRPYDSLDTIWNMVARTAYTQLNYSPGLLIGTVIAMTVVYLFPPLGFLWGIFKGNLILTIVSLFTWLLMAIAYFPTLQLYNCSPLRALTLPGIASLYTLMTIDSAWRHWQGKGGAWKGRIYS